ncbi:AraC family transcriptional regulator [Paenibacillaceae bacterium]|nr:AraC family transcriptional regulator [Paenibacillaceae bacterium]
MVSSPLLIPFETLKTVVAGSIVYPPGGRLKLRVQECIQLMLLDAGTMSIFIDGRELQVEPGHIVLLKPGHEERFVYSVTEQTTCRWISIGITFLSPEAREKLNKLQEYIPVTSEMEQLFDMLMTTKQRTSSVDALMLSLGFTALHLYAMEVKHLFGQQRKHPAVHTVLSWIDQHYQEDITLTRLAEQVNLSPEHLLRLFKQHMFTTPINYLWSCRVERALELLTSTGLPITEITNRCGFKTSQHFSRMMKQSTGRTATEIRQSAWRGAGSGTGIAMVRER